MTSSHDEDRDHGPLQGHGHNRDGHGRDSNATAAADELRLRSVRMTKLCEERGGTAGEGGFSSRAGGKVSIDNKDTS